MNNGLLQKDFTFHSMHVCAKQSFVLRILFKSAIAEMLGKSPLATVVARTESERALVGTSCNIIKPMPAFKKKMIDVGGHGQYRTATLHLSRCLVQASWPEGVEQVGEVLSVHYTIVLKRFMCHLSIDYELEDKF